MELIYGLAISMHFGLVRDYNALHPMVGLDFDGYQIIAYYNSEETISVFGGYRFDLTEDFSIETGLVTGYGHGAFGSFMPMIKANYKNLFFAPAYEDKNGQRIGVTTGLEWRF